MLGPFPSKNKDIHDLRIGGKAAGGERPNVGAIAPEELRPVLLDTLIGMVVLVVVLLEQAIEPVQIHDVVQERVGYEPTTALQSALVPTLFQTAPETNCAYPSNAARGIARRPRNLPILNCPFLIFSANSIPLITMAAVSTLFSPTSAATAA